MTHACTAPRVFFLVYQYVDVVCPVYVSGMCLSETEGPPTMVGGPVRKIFRIWSI